MNAADQKKEAALVAVFRRLPHCQQVRLMKKAKDLEREEAFRTARKIRG